MLTKKRIVLIVLTVLICIITPVLGCALADDGGQRREDMNVITLWQIDSFEGGQGSRAQYLQNKANAFFKGRSNYVIITSISADAARENFKNGNVPDMISYGAGFYGVEGLVNGKDFAYKTWCRGGYFLFSLDENADFSDITAQNTIINVGKDNLTAAAALFAGVDGAAEEKSTAAYVRLISGKYKYLLGTQRDYYRFKARNVSAKIKPLTAFNDLYQNISILSGGEKYSTCAQFVEYLIANNGDVDKLGLFADGKNVHKDELNKYENIKFDLTLKGFVGEEYANNLKSHIKNKEINLVKSLLK